MVFIYLVAALLGSCGYTNQRKMVNIIIEPSNYGWYFIELHKDTVNIGPAEYTVRFKDSSRLQQITVADHDLNFKVYDPAGKEISSRMKIARFVHHANGFKYFEFYNPTDRDLSLVKKWMVTDSVYYNISITDFEELDKHIKSDTTKQ